MHSHGHGCHEEYVIQAFHNTICKDTIYPLFAQDRLLVFQQFYAILHNKTNCQSSMKHIHIFILALVILAGCVNPDIKTLEILRTDVYIKPDSVLSILEDIEPQYILNRNKRTRAEFTLLKSIAQDLAYPGVELVDIRKLSAGAELFERRGPSERRVEAWHCLGKAMFNTGDYRNAIVALSKAEKACTRISSPGIMGTILQDMAKTFRATKDYAEEISYLKKAATEFDKAERPFSSRNARFECGIASYNAHDLVSAEEIFRTMLHEAHSAADTLLEVRCLESYAMLALEQPETAPNLVVSLLSRVTNELHSPLTCIDRGMLAYAYSLSGDNEEAITWLKRAKASAENKYEENQIRFREYQVMSRKKDYRSALEALESVMDYSNASDIAKMRKSAISAEKEYLQQENELASARLQTSRMMILVIVAATLMLIFAFISYFRYRNLQAKKKISEEKAETERYMNIAEDLQIKLKDAGKRLPSEKYLSIAKFDILERLCEQYYIYEGTDNLQSKVLKEVKSIINGLRSDDNTLKGLELMLNRNCGDLVSRLRKQMPKMKEDDIRLFIYSASGFSSTTISTILEKDKSIIYNRIWRLKNKISSSDVIDKDDFLHALEK